MCTFSKVRHPCTHSNLALRESVCARLLWVHLPFVCSLSVLLRGVLADAGHNVVLVDTAGRMQDNEPLMRALSKLVNMNKPDLVLFVGEALVGNEAVDQLSKYSKGYLSRCSPLCFSLCA